MNKYGFYIAYSYTRDRAFGFGSCTIFKENNNIRVKELEDELKEDLKKEGIADNAVIINVLPITIKGIKIKN